MIKKNKAYYPDEVKKCGNSLHIKIPPKDARELKIKIGNTVKVIIEKIDLSKK